MRCRAYACITHPHHQSVFMAHILSSCGLGPCGSHAPYLCARRPNLSIFLWTAARFVDLLRGGRVEYGLQVWVLCGPLASSSLVCLLCGCVAAVPVQPDHFEDSSLGHVLEVCMAACAEHCSIYCPGIASSQKGVCRDPGSGLPAGLSSIACGSVSVRGLLQVGDLQRSKDPAVLSCARVPQCWQ